MCQQWFSVIGLIFDIAGFLLIANEWWWAIRLQGGEKVQEIGEIGERAARQRRGEPEVISRAEQKAMWEGWMSQWKIRTRRFRLGATLIVLGFVGQLLGSLPHGIPYFPFRPC